MSISSILVGARIVVYINGEEYALVSQASWDVAAPRKAIFAVDSAIAYELAPTTVQVMGNLSVYRLIQDGGLEGYGITQFPSDILSEKYVTITMVDSKSDSVLFAANQCAIVSQRWDIPSKGIVKGTLVFQAIDWYNEAHEPAR